MKLQLSILLSIFTCATLSAMQAKNLDKKEDSPVQRQLTLIDIDQMDQSKFAALSDIQKWKFCDDSRNLMRKYARTVADQNLALQELRGLVVGKTVSFFFVNAQPNDQTK